MGPVWPEWEAEACSRKTWTKNIDSEIQKKKKTEKILYTLKSNEGCDGLHQLLKEEEENESRPASPWGRNKRKE